MTDTSASIVVLAPFLARTGSEQQMRTQLLEMFGSTRSVGETISDDLNQLADRPAVLDLYERWADKAVPGRRMQTPHPKALAEDALQADPFSVVVVTRIVGMPA